MMKLVIRALMGAAIGCTVMVGTATAVDAQGPQPANQPTAQHFVIPQSVLSELNGPPTLATAMGDPLATFEAHLLQDHPATYGGIYMNPDGSYTVNVVGNDPALEAEAGSLSSLLPTSTGGSAVLHFGVGARSLDSLYTIKDSIWSETQTAFQSMPDNDIQGIHGVGIDAEHDQVVLSTTEPGLTSANTGGVSPAVHTRDLQVGAFALAAVEDQYGPAVRPVAVADPQLTARTSDSAPYTSGDQIVEDLAFGWQGCSSGFGIKLPNGAEAVLSAGHCVVPVDGVAFYTDWFNGNYIAKIEGPWFGNTVSWSNQGIDTQVIDGSRYSCYMWDNVAGQTPTREGITGYIDAPIGATVYNEGSSSGSHSGVVWQTNASENISGESLQDLVGYTAPVQTGDSGGPMVYPTSVGPLAAGTITAAANSGTYTYAEEIDAVMFVWAYHFGGLSMLTYPSHCS
jgi:hypothetical protein